MISLQITTMKVLGVLLLAVVGIATVTAHIGHHGMYRGYGSMYGMRYGYPGYGYGSLYGGYGGLGYGYGYGYPYGGIGYGSMYGGYGYPYGGMGYGSMYGGLGYGSMYGGLGYGGYRRYGGYGYKHGKYPRYISSMYTLLHLKYCLEMKITLFTLCVSINFSSRINIYFKL